MLSICSYLFSYNSSIILQLSINLKDTVWVHMGNAAATRIILLLMCSLMWISVSIFVDVFLMQLGVNITLCLMEKYQNVVQSRVGRLKKGMEIQHIPAGS